MKESTRSKNSIPMTSIAGHESDTHSITDINESEDEEDPPPPNSSDNPDGGPVPLTEDIRTIHIQEPHLNKYCTNYISTGKYNILTFCPLFLFEQFRRYSNIFFLFIALLQQIPDVSPTGRYTTLFPLIFILSVSALKEIVEDIKRHRADNETNHRKVDVLKEIGWVATRWKDIHAGDIIKVKNDNFFPADLLLLASSEPKAICFIETANLDGETNLKIRSGLQHTSEWKEEYQLRNFRGIIECELPNRHLYEFIGTLRDGNDAIPLGPDQLLLRGAVLRNTDWVYAIVVYTGRDSKLMHNSSSAPLKRSKIDQLTNWNILIIFFIHALLSAGSTLGYFLWNSYHSEDWYIGLKDSSFNVGYSLLTFIILYNNLIPISLQVTLELVRYLQAYFINNDIEMYHEESNTPAMARTSNLNEELGQVEYVFSDKTGTLTQNVMEFKKCAIGTEVYDIGDRLILEHLEQGHKNTKMIKQFLTLLSVCHTVIPEKINGSVIYHAASPDERALVVGANCFEYIFESRTPESVIINARGTKVKYDILCVLEFTSDRKRMSVIVKDTDGKIKIFCKGADSVIYERLSASEQQQFDTLKSHLKDFATDGLRTLCLAYADISDGAYEQWKVEERKAATSVLNREKNLERVYDLIERNLCLLGATAIEDKLQDNVPKTIASLLEANIKVWVLTGDKQETAINIGFSCQLIKTDMTLLTMRGETLDDTRGELLEYIDKYRESIEKKESILVCLIINGKTLKHALGNDLRNEFLSLCIICKSVICCRVSPMQKAEVVHYVTEKTGAVTLAIGDGANDVAMIQKAHIGVGISGVEGLQAACASDYSIAQFQYLARLLLVHGAWNYFRISNLILYSFYKNICLYVINFWYAIYSGWSGQILFERWTMGLYNVFFTALPPFAMGLFDKPFTCDILKNPKLYLPSQKSEFFNVTVFWKWIINALLHSVLIYYGVIYSFQGVVLWENGREGGSLVIGNIAYTCTVVIVSLKAGLITNSWTMFTHMAIWGSIGLWILFLAVYSYVWPYLPIGSIMSRQVELLFTSLLFAPGVVLISMAVLLPDYIMRLYSKRKSHKLVKKFVQQNELMESEGSAYTPAHALETILQYGLGYAFSQEEGASVSQTDVIRSYDTSTKKNKAGKST